MGAWPGTLTQAPRINVVVVLGWVSVVVGSEVVAAKDPVGLRFLFDICQKQLKSSLLGTGAHGPHGGPCLPTSRLRPNDSAL